MGFWKRLFRPGAHDKELADQVVKQVEAEAGDMANVFSGQRGYGAPRGTRENLRRYKQNHKYRSTVARIAETVAAVPLHAAYIREPDTGRAVRHKLHRAQDPETREQWLKEAREEGNLVDLPDHPLAVMLDAGNEYMSGFDVRKLTSIYLDTVGEAFWLLVRNNAGMPVEIWPVPPHWVQETPSSDKPFFKVNFGNKEVPAENMIWFRELDPENPFARGAGLGETLNDELDTDEYAARLTKAVFVNRAIPSGIVSLAGAGAEAVERYQEEWNQQHRGYQRAGLVKFTNGVATFTRVDQALDELQLIPLRESIRDAVQQTYGVPPEVQGNVEDSNRASITAAATFMAEYVVTPRLEQFLRVIKHQLLPQFDDRLILYYESPAPVDKAARFEAAKEFPWAITVNEIRTEFMGMDPVAGGDVYYVPVNLIRVPAQPAAEPEEEPASEPATDDGEEPGIPEPGEEQVQPAAAASRLIIVKQTPAELEQLLVEDVLESLQPERLTTEVMPIWRDQLPVWGDKVLAELGVDISFNILNPRVVEHLADFAGNRIPDLINQTTEDALRGTLVEGVRAGEGIDLLKERVHDVFLEGDLDIYNVRARRIAVTEVNRSANFGNWEAQRQSGVVESRQWAASFVNTRDTHATLHAKDPVPIDQPFEINGLTAFYPGSFGDPGEDINCMCTTLAVISEPKDAEYLYKQNEIFQVEKIPWERMAADAFIRGFEAQQQDVLDALDRAAAVLEAA